MTVRPCGTVGGSDKRAALIGKQTVLTKLAKTTMASAETIELKVLGNHIPRSTPGKVVEGDDEADQLPPEVRSEFESIKRALSSFERKLKKSTSSMSRGDAEVVS